VLILKENLSRVCQMALDRLALDQLAFDQLTHWHLKGLKSNNSVDETFQNHIHNIFFLRNLRTDPVS
jgi:hypothetical protein